MDTVSFLGIVGMTTVCYSVVSYVILYAETCGFSLTLITRLLAEGFWALFGELGFELGSCKYDISLDNSRIIVLVTINEVTYTRGKSR
jgi:hypothetical protein